MSRTTRPAPARAARTAALPVLPVFLKLRGRTALLAGGGEPAAWKAELLAAAGARVRVLAAEPCEEMVAVAAASDGAVVIEPRAWAPGDLDGAALAVAEIEEDGPAAVFAAAARARGIPVNVIDRPAFCDFQFGALVNRDPVVVAITTDGAAPVLGQALRRRFEALLPRALGASAAAAGAFRDRLARLKPDKRDRRAFWERFVDEALAGAAPLDAPALEALARGAAGARGEVLLVGAGPGDPELLTLKAVRALQSADVIVHDRLASADVLEMGRREAERIGVGKEGHGAACRQEDINGLIVRLALEGRRVVRLKGGDPAVFGRAGEEVAACRAAGVRVTIVPGVTTASAAGAALNLSLTHRDHAQRLQFVTGHDRHGRVPADLDLAALADPRATTIIYMARRSAPALARALIARGAAADLPVVVASAVSRPDQHLARLTLARLADGEVPAPVGAPVLVLMGWAMGEGADAGVITDALSAAPRVLDFAAP